MKDSEAIRHMWDSLPKEQQIRYSYLCLHPTDPARIIIFAQNMQWDVFPQDVVGYLSPEDIQKMISDFLAANLQIPCTSL